MTGPFNDRRNSRWSDLDARRPENVPFAQWVEDQSRRSNEANGQWMDGHALVSEIEQVLAGDRPMPPRSRRRRAGDPGE